MAKFTIAAVKDELSGTFLQPTFAGTLDEIKRSFKYQINNNPIWRDNPSDFSLYNIGEFDDQTGEIISSVYKEVSGHTLKEVRE